MSTIFPITDTAPAAARGAVPMTGTTRAALRLALGVLRGDILRWPRNDYAIESLGRAAAVAFDPIVIDAARAAHRAETWHEYRPIRARLALLLRTVLRAEAGDEWDMERAEPDEAGEWHAFERSPAEWIIVCEGCRARLGPRCGFVAGDTTTEPCPITGKPERVRLAVPLWSQAPGVRVLDARSAGSDRGNPRSDEGEGMSDHHDEAAERERALREALANVLRDAGWDMAYTWVPGDVAPFVGRVLAAANDRTIGWQRIAEVHGSAKDAAESDRDRLAAEVERLTRERDEYKACWLRDVEKGRAAEERLRAERVASSAAWSSSHAAMLAAVERVTRERDEARESLRLLRNEALAGLDAGQLRRLREANERARKAERERDSIRDEAARDLREYRDAANRAAAEHDASLAHALAASSAATEQAIALGRRVDDLVADRNTLAAALAEVREAVTDYRTIDTEPEWERASDRLDAVLAATPADLATAHDARVRAETLRAAADLADRGSERGGWQDDAPLSGDVLPHEVADWLRAEADRRWAMTNEQRRVKERLVRLENAVGAYLDRFEERLDGRGTTPALTDALADVAALMGRAELADALRDTTERGRR